MRITKILARLLLSLVLCSGYAAAANAADDTFTVSLPCVTDWEHGWYDQYHLCAQDEIEIPKGRPIYALLVSGFHQNRDLNMFHFYNFAKCLQEQGAYVHYAWWNNLLAPYMERPLHWAGSVPSTHLTPWDDMWGFLYGSTGRRYPTKAIPADDHQFQLDAVTLLTRIYEENPNAAIILVGHSMGGAAVARLAAYTSMFLPDIEITLLAPIDPVGNRTCLPSSWSPNGWHCSGNNTFKRHYAVHHTDDYDSPTELKLGENIKYLYHRWQEEFSPPFDWAVEVHFAFEDGRARGWSIDDNSTNIQNNIIANDWSGVDAHPKNVGLDLSPENWLGGNDGHGEIVGFRGIKPASTESWALALDAPHNWPSLDRERSYDESWCSITPMRECVVDTDCPQGETCEPDPRAAEVRDHRVALMKSWETDPDYFDKYWAPQKPKYKYCNDHFLHGKLEGDYCTFCMVSGDLCTILKNKLVLDVNLEPEADAGPRQIVECSGPNGTEVTLDGSGSTDSDGDPLTFEWAGPFGTMTGESIYPYLPLGAHSITLTVDDGKGNTDTDTVDVIVMDSTPPSLSISLSPARLWPPNHRMRRIEASIETSDTCDVSPNVKLVSIISNEADNGVGDGNTENDIQGASYGTDDRTFLLRAEVAGKIYRRIYTVTYSSTDASGNVSEDGIAKVTVLQDRSRPKYPRR